MVRSKKIKWQPFSKRHKEYIAACLRHTYNFAEGFAAGDEITLTDSHTANLAFHKNAFGFISRPLEKARGAESYVTSYNGITLRVTFGYNIATKKQTMSVDTLYGFKTLYPELAVRVLGE